MLGIGANCFGQKPVTARAQQPCSPQFKGHFAFQKPEPCLPAPGQDELVQTIRNTAGKDNVQKAYTIFVDDVPDDNRRFSKFSDKTVAFFVLSVADEKDSDVQAALNQQIGADGYHYAKTKSELTQQLVKKWSTSTRTEPDKVTS